jgi:ssRNA-specific RNase YbeY (16S rRNA maturation enzyme)
MEKKLKKLIQKLHKENDARYDRLKLCLLDDESRRRINHKYNYTCELIQQLENCL